jgi:hypothetical protein
VSAESPQEPEELAEAVRSLSGTVDALRVDVRRMGAAAVLPSDERDSETTRTWVSALEVPAPRRPAVPRFLLETLFLVACAAAAAIAELDAVAILGVMAELDDGSTATFPSAFTVSAEQTIATASSGGTSASTKLTIGWIRRDRCPEDDRRM